MSVPFATGVPALVPVPVTVPVTVTVPVAVTSPVAPTPVGSTLGPASGDSDVPGVSRVAWGTAEVASAALGWLPAWDAQPAIRTSSASAATD